MLRDNISAPWFSLPGRCAALTDFGLDFNLVGWILDFLTDRTQRVRVNGSLSAPLITSTGTPQGCVLSPLLYILYTNNCMSKHSNRFF